jgi:DNA topoisomerase IB
VPLSDAGIAKLLKGDLDLNAQGLITWIDRRKRS